MTTIETTPSGDSITVRRTGMAPGHLAGIIIWALVLVIGFAAVIGLGSPITDDRGLLDKAYHPTPPVSEAQAIQSAETIVRIDYPQFANGVRTVTHENDFGDDRYTIVYRIPRQLTGVRIAVSVKGSVTVGQYP